MNIRPIERNDIDRCIQIGRDMHEESRYSSLEYKPTKILQLIEATFSMPESYCLFVAEQEGEIIGLLVGFCVEYWFGTDKQTSDLAIYVAPEKRGTTTAPRLIRAYEKWASNLGVNEITVSTSTGVETERTIGLFQRLGYQPTAYAYSKRN